MRTTSDSIGFSQFVNYLFYRFPHVKKMTGFEVKRFEQKSRNTTTLEEKVKRRDSVLTMRSQMTMKSLAEPDAKPDDTEVTGIRVINTENISLKRKKTVERKKT